MISEAPLTAWGACLPGFFIFCLEQGSEAGMKLKLKFEIIKKVGSQAKFSQIIGLDESAVSRVIHQRRVLSEEEKAT